MAQPAPPTIIADRLEVVARLHDRGLGEVWHCRDPQRAGGPVMVKLLRPVGPALPPPLEALLQRSKLARHESILRVFSFGLWGARPYVVYEFFEGSSLGDGLDRARAEGSLLPMELLREAFDGVVAAFDAAHRAPKQLLHMSVDLSSVIMRRLPDKPLKLKVLDFGLAAWADPDPETPKSGARTLGSAAPEAFNQGQPSPRSDVFSLGALLRDLLATPPPPGEAMVAAGVARRRDDVPDAVWAEIVRATQLDPSARHPSIREFADAMRVAWSQPLPVVAKPAAPTPAQPKDQAPSLHEAPASRSPSGSPPAALAALPLGGLMPALMAASKGDVNATIVLADVAARRPSPWDIGGLRDERAEAEERAAEQWFAQRQNDDETTRRKGEPRSAPDATFVASNPSGGPVRAADMLKELARGTAPRPPENGVGDRASGAGSGDRPLEEGIGDTIVMLAPSEAARSQVVTPAPGMAPPVAAWTPPLHHHATTPMPMPTPTPVPIVQSPSAPAKSSKGWVFLVVGLGLFATVAVVAGLLITSP